MLLLEPAAGIEPATGGLQNHYSTAELRWHQSLANKGVFARFRLPEKMGC